MKDVGHWHEATTRTLEAPQNAKKPLRDRLALREKLINDISTQKTKISYAVEKLNVSPSFRYRFFTSSLQIFVRS